MLSIDRVRRSACSGGAGATAESAVCDAVAVVQGGGAPDAKRVRRDT